MIIRTSVWTKAAWIKHWIEGNPQFSPPPTSAIYSRPLMSSQTNKMRICVYWYHRFRHTNIVCFKDIFKECFSASTARSPGTLYFMKNMFQHRNVSSDLKACFNHATELMEALMDAYVVGTAMRDIHIATYDQRPQICSATGCLLISSHWCRDGSGIPTQGGPVMPYSSIPKECICLTLENIIMISLQSLTVIYTTMC